MDRLTGIRQRTEAGGPILCIDMKYLLSEVARLNCKLQDERKEHSEEYARLRSTYISKAAALTARAEAEKGGRCVVLPCKVGDICYEVDPGHPGTITHTVTGTTVYNRQADGNRYMTDFVNVIVIDTWAVAEDGCEWADQYTVAEWADAPKTRPEAEAALNDAHKPGGEQT